jgi:hypothetical protein
MPKDKKVKQRATSSYLRRKKNVYRGLDEADPDYNPIDAQAEEMEREEEERRGITDHIRSIFK